MSDVDSCYSWVVASATFIIFLLASCPVRLGAQLFVSMLDNYGITRKEASFPFALSVIVRCIAGPFAGILGEIFSFQGVTIVGCLLCALGVGGCFFAEEILAINICFGLVYGIGYSWSNALLPEILNRCFKKHRSKAYGLYLSGGGLGSFLTPPLLDLILKEFGLSGTFLVSGGILLNTIPFAMLLTVTKREKKIDHQLLMPANSSNKKIENSQNEFHLNDFKEQLEIRTEFSEIRFKNSEERSIENPVTVLIKYDKKESKNANKSITSTNKKHSINDLNVVPILSDIREQSNIDGYINCSYKNKLQNASEIPNLKHDVASKSHTSDKFPETQLQNSSMKQCRENNVTKLEAPSKVTIGNEETKKGVSVSLNEQVEECKTNFNSHRSQNVSATEIQLENGKIEQITSNPIVVLKENEVPENTKISLFDKLSIIWSPVFLTITTSLAVNGYTNLVIWTITVDFVRDKGIEQYLEVYFVMCLSLFDTIGRLLLGSIIDVGLMTITQFTIFCYAFNGLVLVMLIWLPEFFSLMVGFSLVGLSFGGITISTPALITEFVEKEKRSIAMASRLIIIAPITFTISPAIGFFRGSLGSYDGLLYTMASMCFISVIMLLLLPVIAKKKQKKRDPLQMNKEKI